MPIALRVSLVSAGSVPVACRGNSAGELDALVSFIALAVLLAEDRSGTTLRCLSIAGRGLSGLACGPCVFGRPEVVPLVPGSCMDTGRFCRAKPGGACFAPNADGLEADRL